MSYRKYEYGFEDKKNNWIKNEYLTRHSGDINHYEAVKDIDREKREFMELYGNRCIYCGVKFSHVPTSFCEIDHVLPKKYYPQKKQDLDNLVCACRSCNRSKAQKELPNNINPDENILCTYLKRNKEYKIIPTNNSRNVSMELIGILGLDKRQHQLFFLVEEIGVIIEGMDHGAIRSKLYEVKSRLEEEARNEV